ncbi:MAG: hypothetical protein WCG47_29580, partial [Dermatophilaceae bacterium]
ARPPSSSISSEKDPCLNDPTPQLAGHDTYHKGSATAWIGIFAGQGPVSVWAILGSNQSERYWATCSPMCEYAG